MLLADQGLAAQRMQAVAGGLRFGVESTLMEIYNESCTDLYVEGKGLATYATICADSFEEPVIKIAQWEWEKGRSEVNPALKCCWF
jgi:hypothetical protein